MRIRSMAKKKKPEPSVAEDATIAAEALPDLPVSDGIADAVIEPLFEDEIIGETREYLLRVGEKVYHHTRDASDGRWIYRPLK
jgi:hypothetical protein